MRIINHSFLTVIAVGVFMVACSNDKIVSKTGVLQYVNETYDISSDYKDLEVLELKGDYGLVKLGSIVIEKDKIFAVDWQKARILVFNTQGEFLYEIYKRGDGPGEYRGISKISIHNDQLIIFSHYEMAIHKYDLEGNFIEKVVLPDRPYNVVFLKDVIVGYLNYNSMHAESNNIQIYDYDGKLLKQGFPYNAENASPTGMSGSVTADFPKSNNFYFAPAFESKIYKLDENLNVLEDISFEGFHNYWPYGIDNEKIELLKKSDYSYMINISSRFLDISFFRYQAQGRLKHGVLRFDENKVYGDAASGYLPYFMGNYVGSDAAGYGYFVPQFDFLYMMLMHMDEPEELLPQAIKDNFNNIKSEDFVFLIRKKNI
jgi:hypothetical protein